MTGKGTHAHAWCRDDDQYQRQEGDNHRHTRPQDGGKLGKETVRSIGEEQALRADDLVDTMRTLR